MRYFRVLNGQYEPRGINARRYNKGEVVPSTIDLVKEFGSNRFREVNAKGRAIGDADISDEEIADDEDAVTDLENESAREETKAPKKSKKDAKSEVPQGSDDAKSEDEPAESSDDDKIESSLGEDVTSEFPENVRDNDLAVVKKGKKYFVVDRDTPDTALVGKDKKEPKLSSVEEVKSFVEEFLKG